MQSNAVVPEHDPLFKRLLHVLFPEFLEGFVPDVYRELDPKSIQFLDKELVRARGLRQKTKLVDLVVRVKFRTGDMWNTKGGGSGKSV